MKSKRLLRVRDVAQEYGLSYTMARSIFNDPESGAFKLHVRGVFLITEANLRAYFKRRQPAGRPA